jgi:hypothetical protein
MANFKQLEGYGRDLIKVSHRYIPGWTEKNKKNIRARISAVLDEHLPNTSLYRYRYNGLLGKFNLKQALSLFKTNSGALVRQRTIDLPTERPPLVAEVSANFSG